ncbi:MAG: universal stress protein [Burkholderiales bacterium]|jgi:nucleotide-binding universal stress UspA family protein|nr:universal stress protein [Burkholderiales bacterium]MCA3160850.1 universal stress protein [Burkholderiales bacterium]MCA3163639.1 universal stress protein [Burkholderiales bacterium]MCA3166592.1 universal stress protein [Burkholderiales bacterium]MCA3170057.1 universal stress protein [Burkholderiales bacterium]
MIDRLVAAIDGSEAAKRSLDTMINLAKAMTTQPDIVLVSVKVPMPPLTGMGVVVSEDLLDAYYEKAQQETLAAAEQKLSAAGLKYSVRKELGDPAEFIVRAAEETGAKMIFMGSRGMGAFGNLMLGSTSNKVLHLSKVPVVVTH